MSHLFEPTLCLAQFKLPPQDITLLSFCESNKLAKVQAWVDDLKVTQVKSTSIELYEALPEIAHLKVDAKTRFDMLEALWPVTQQCLLGLLKEFLQQPLILPEPAQKTALLAQARDRELDTVDGVDMLIGQAALAFELFFGAEPPRDRDEELRELLTR